jgi:hypothetical protein
MDPKSTASERMFYTMFNEDTPSQSSKRSQGFRCQTGRDEPSSDRKGYKPDGTEPDQTFTGPSDSLLSSPSNFKVGSDHFAESNFIAPALNLEYADLKDYLSFKNIEMADDVKYDFNQGAPDLFLRHSPDSIDRLFDYNSQRRDSFSEAIKASTENA